MRRLFLFLAFFAAFSYGHAQEQEMETMDALSDRVFDLARVQAVYMDSLLTAMEMPGQAGHDVMAGPDRPSLYPRTFQGDTLVTSGIDWWCSGFYPGVLWQLFFETGERTYWELALKYTVPLSGLLDRETDHDIGFQLMSSFGPLQDFLRMSDLSRYSSVLSSRVQTPDPSEVNDILSRGAAKLAARFVPEAGVIRSWNWGPWNIPVIIDNMMNLELLDAAGYWEITEKHALTTLKNHFREDGTVWHLVDYDDDGTILGKQTVQGYADDTAWARGQAWALYGYARMAERRADWTEPEVHFQPFHNAAAKLEAWLLENLPEDGIPYWDFSQSDYKDASAGAIIACGLLKMWNLGGRNPSDPAISMAERILRTLASPEYLAEPRTNGGFLLKHGVGNLPSNSEVDVPLTYADYYFLEALSLYPLEN